MEDTPRPLSDEWFDWLYSTSDPEIPEFALRAARYIARNNSIVDPVRVLAVAHTITQEVMKAINRKEIQL